MRYVPSTLAALLASTGLLACSANDDTSAAARGAGEGVAAGPGVLGLAITVEGLTISTVEVEITSEDATPPVVRNRTLDVSDPTATISASEHGLPAGSYAVTLTAAVADDPSTELDESTIACSGTAAGVEVVVGEVSEVNDLLLICTIDGGEIRRAGGIRVNAHAQVETVNQCEDLIASAFVAVHDSTVGSSVQLGAEPVSGATLAWTATGGTIAEDATSYTCPAIPGEYTVTVTATSGDCTETFSEVVRCHSSYDGACEALPSAFAWEGDCGLRSPCHLLSQQGCAWSASCRGQIISGEGTSATEFPFAYRRGDTQLDCSVALQDGELVGSCRDAETTCSLNSNQKPAPLATCEHVLEVEDVAGCGEKVAACDVIQDGCSFQAKCDDGSLPTGSVNGATLTWDIDDRSTTGQRYRCVGDVADGRASGSCELRDGEGPLSCDFGASVHTLDLGSCAQTLPANAFKLSGCSLDGAAFAAQRGCVWELVTEAAGTLSGVASADNSFEFDNPIGQRCVGKVEDGELGGSCGSGEAACTFKTVKPEVDGSCLQLPDVVATRGCGFGAPTGFATLQDGCEFHVYAASRRVYVSGEVTATGIAFPGISEGWVCRADLNEEVNELWGECTRENEDGTVSQCRDFSDEQGARLVIAL